LRTSETANLGSDRAPCGPVVTDRGFATADNSRTLKQGGTFDGLCPRQRAELSRRMQDKKFARLRRRRGQTEG
jgi:hypothetical protein